MRKPGRDQLEYGGYPNNGSDCDTRILHSIPPRSIQLWYGQKITQSQHDSDCKQATCDQRKMIVLIASYNFVPLRLFHNIAVSSSDQIQKTLFH